MTNPTSPIIKYKALPASPRINRVECSRESASTVWDLEGRREAKESISRIVPHKYCDTWGEAHAVLMRHAEQRLERARTEAKSAQAVLYKCERMLNPEVHTATRSLTQTTNALL